jgi:hypothetical protein
LLPVVRERQQLADGLARYLGQLGLERKEKEMDVASLIAALHGRSADPTHRTVVYDASGDGLE